MEQGYGGRCGAAPGPGPSPHPGWRLGPLAGFGGGFPVNGGEESGRLAVAAGGVQPLWEGVVPASRERAPPLIGSAPRRSALGRRRLVEGCYSRLGGEGGRSLLLTPPPPATRPGCVMGRRGGGRKWSRSHF